MKFKIYWLECHNPLNWDITNGKGIKEMYRLLPAKNIQLDPNGDDGWVECECEDFFEAENIEEAKIKTNEYVVGSSGVFTVFNAKTREVAFTEEDC